MAPKPVIPVLMSDINRLSKPLDIVKYVLRSYMHYPRNINDTFADREVSFIWDAAEAGWQSETLGEHVRSNLLKVLRPYFPEASSLEVEVDIVVVDEVRYNVSVDVMLVTGGQTYHLTQDYEVDQQGNLKYTFKGGGAD